MDYLLPIDFRIIGYSQIKTAIKECKMNRDCSEAQFFLRLKVYNSICFLANIVLGESGGETSQS